MTKEKTRSFKKLEAALNVSNIATFENNFVRAVFFSDDVLQHARIKCKDFDIDMFVSDDTLIFYLNDKVMELTKNIDLDDDWDYFTLSQVFDCKNPNVITLDVSESSQVRFELTKTGFNLFLLNNGVDALISSLDDKEFIFPTTGVNHTWTNSFIDLNRLCEKGEE